MFTLRPYQQAGVDAALEYLTSKKYKGPGVIVAPTGAGKSLYIGNLVSRLDAPALVLQPSVELLTQNYQKCLSYGMKASIYSASRGIKEIGEITYATLGSIKNIAEEFNNIGVKYLLIDEAHFQYSPNEDSMFSKFIKEMKDIRVIGFTATPFRLKQLSFNMESYSQLNMLTRMKPKFFNNMIHITQIQDICNEFWCPLEYEDWGFDMKELILNSNGSEYTVGSVDKAIHVNNTNNKIAIRVRVLIKEGRQSILVFMNSVENAEIITNWTNRVLGEGTAAYVCGKTPKKQRNQIIEDFKNGKIKVVYNVKCLSVGFDHPDLDTVILGTPTNSLAIYYQEVGRVVRPFINSKFKKALVIDAVQNWQKFGRITDITIESIPGYGWACCSGDKVLTNVRMDMVTYKNQVTKNRIIITTKEGEETNVGELTDYEKEIIWFGKYEGTRIGNLPGFYIDFLATKINNPSSNRMKELVTWAKNKKGIKI